MGFFKNLFKRKAKTKTLLLEEGKSEQKEIKQDKVNVKIFSKKTGEDIEYNIRIVSNEEEIHVGTIYGNIDNTNIPLKTVARDIERVVQPLVGKEGAHGLSSLKEKTKLRLNRIADNNNFDLSEEMLQYITEYKYIDYDKLEKISKKIDISKLTVDEIIQIGQKLQHRLDELDRIQTPDDAYEDRENIIAYMHDRENLPVNPIVEASLQSEQEGVTLDEETILRIAQNMEGIRNEDGALYSVYLKIEEKRIWKQAHEKIMEHLNDSENELTEEQEKELNTLLEKLDQYELKDINGGLSSEVLNYVMNQMKEMDIVTYAQEYKEADALLAKTINNNYSETSDKQQILQFLYARIGSLGQLSYKPLRNNNSVLRNFVINTDFKHEDNQETKEFLFLVSKIEKEYIKNQYEQIISASKEKQNDNMTFKERLNVADNVSPITNVYVGGKDEIEKEDVTK